MHIFVPKFRLIGGIVRAENFWVLDKLSWTETKINIPQTALVLTLGTAWLGLNIFNFRKSPFLPSLIRELISDYALAISVIVFSLIGSVGFSAIKISTFTYGDLSLEVTKTLGDLPASGWGWATLLGFCLSLLFFMDQNISAALVNTPANKLKKGAAYHLDLFVVAIINIPLSLLGKSDFSIPTKFFYSTKNLTLSSGRDFVQNFVPKLFFQLRASYYFQAYEFRDLRLLLTNLYFKSTLELQNLKSTKLSLLVIPIPKLRFLK